MHLSRFKPKNILELPLRPLGVVFYKEINPYISRNLEKNKFKKKGGPQKKNFKKREKLLNNNYGNKGLNQ